MTKQQEDELRRFLTSGAANIMGVSLRQLVEAMFGEIDRLRADVARLKAEKEAAYTALEGRLGCGDDDAGKTQKVLWACEAHVLAEDALPGDEFDSEDYSLPKAVAALVKQRDGERDENERLRADVARLREALKKVVAVSADRERFVMQGPRGFAVAERIAKEVLAATDPETRS